MSLEEQKAIAAGLVRSAFLALLAEAQCRDRRIEEGMQSVDEGFEHASRTSEGGYVAELHRVRGELLLLKGDTAGAEASMREALHYAGQQQARSFELRAALALAKLLVSAGRRDEARAALSPIYDWFTEGFETADLVGARTLLSEIG